MDQLIALSILSFLTAVFLRLMRLAGPKLEWAFLAIASAIILYVASVSIEVIVGLYRLLPYGVGW